MVYRENGYGYTVNATGVPARSASVGADGNCSSIERKAMMNVLRRWWYALNQMLDEAADKREVRRIAHQRAYLIQQQSAAQQRGWTLQQLQQWQQMNEWIEDDEDIYHEEHMMHEVDHDFYDPYDF